MEEEGLADHGIRVIARRRGRTRMAYELDFVGPGEALEDETAFETGSLTLWLTPESIENLRGTTIDFVDNGYQSGFKFENPNTKIEWDDPVASRLQKLLDDEINPSVASHGGYIDLLDYKEGTAYIEMGGGCQGCGQASVTLRQGVESKVREAVPEVKNIIDTTQHAEGKNPYYQSTEG